LLDITKDNLKIHEDKLKGIYIEDVTERCLISEKEVFHLMNEGNSNRSVGVTDMNAQSSRSHSIFILSITQNDNINMTCKIGKLFLVDLAGSEKVGKTNAKGQTLEEAKSINKSLTMLGMVINSLTDGKSSHIPYRDSKLTRMLQESLGGNSKTCLIITLSPSMYNAEETLSTCRFGMRAKCIKNNAKINKQVTVGELRIIISKLEKELEIKNNRISQLEKCILDIGGIIPIDNMGRSISSNPTLTEEAIIKELGSPELLEEKSMDIPLNEFIHNNENDLLTSPKRNKANDFESVSPRIEENKIKQVNTTEIKPGGDFFFPRAARSSRVLILKTSHLDNLYIEFKQKLVKEKTSIQVNESIYKKIIEKLKSENEKVKEEVKLNEGKKQLLSYYIKKQNAFVEKLKIEKELLINRVAQIKLDKEGKEPLNIESDKLSSPSKNLIGQMNNSSITWIEEDEKRSVNQHEKNEFNFIDDSMDLNLNFNLNQDTRNLDNTFWELIGKLFIQDLKEFISSISKYSFIEQIESNEKAIFSKILAIIESSNVFSPSQQIKSLIVCNN